MLRPFAATLALLLLMGCRCDSTRDEAPSGGTAAVETGPSGGFVAAEPRRVRPTVDATTVARFEEYLQTLTALVGKTKTAFRAATPATMKDTSGGTVSVPSWRDQLTKARPGLMKAARDRVGLTEAEVAAIEELESHLLAIASDAEVTERSLSQLKLAPLDQLPPARRREVEGTIEQQSRKLAAEKNADAARRVFGDAAVDAYRARAEELKRLRAELVRTAAD